ncbi:MAG: hypothetical protein QOF02_1295 [Blastocatellia bacterium]|nr:hypothetical protein [Blastocatellia bacterium]
MKRIKIAAVIVMLCAASGFAQTGSRRRAAAVLAEQSVINIQQIDFRNYTLPLDGKAYKLIDGFYAGTVAPGAQWELALADGPYYVDLTGDKKAEAVFVLRYGPVDAPNMAEARVYTLRDGKPALLATFTVASNVRCEMVNYLKVEDGTVMVERIYGEGSRCDHNEITQYRWNGNSFVAVGDVRRTRCQCINQ